MISDDERLAFLERRGAATAAHANGRTLLEHLVATKSVIEAWRLRADIARAALFHSVYGTESFDPRTATPRADRERVRALVGVEAERLVELFCTLPRADVRRQLEATGSEQALVLRRRANDGFERVTPRELFGLVALYAANDFEQCCAPDGSPAHALSRLRANLRFLSARHGRLPWIASDPAANVTAAQDAELVALYRSGVASLGYDAAAASAAFTALFERCPFLPEPCAWLAYAAVLAAQPRAALVWLDRAETNLRRLGAPWDKRLRAHEWFGFIAMLRGRATRRELAADIALPAPFAAAVETGAHDRERFYRFIDAYIDPATPGAIAMYPGLASKPWHAPALFPIVRELEAACGQIAAELARVPAQRFQRESEPIERAGDWDVFMLYERGRRHDEHCALLPTATRIIERFDTVRTFIGLSYVSRLLPGTRIAPHRGPTNLRVRCHLPLLVPAGDCALRVGEETRRWEAGKCLIFDDSYVHEAWNATTEPRVVLIVDLWNPALSPGELRLVRRFADRILRQTSNLVRYWSNNERAHARPALRDSHHVPDAT